VKIAEMRELNQAEIEAQVSQIREELFRLRFRGATQELENSALLRQLRRDLARLKTVQRQRELEQGER
jgi:large subunit ribosomal protein L29